VRKLALSSIRAPRLGNVQRDVKDEPYAFEAKEMLRKSVIGKRVAVQIDYVRPIPIGGPESGKSEDRAFATVIDDKGRNLAVMLVQQGLASVIRHRGDEPRSLVYDEMLQVEAEAKEQHRGLHSGKTPAPRHVNDLSTPAAATQAKALFPSLQRAGRMRGVVEFVINGSRLKVNIPKESCTITLALAGARCPATGRRDGTEPEPFGEAAVAYTRDRCLQHDVEVEVEAQDRMGAFIGTCWVKGHNLGVLLIEEGLAKLQPGFKPMWVQHDGEALLACEERAKASRLRVWTDYVEPTPEVEDDTPAVVQQKIRVVCTHVQDGCNVFLQSVTEAAATLNKLQETLKEIAATAPVPGFNPRVNDVVAAEFSCDGNWYRARVDKKSAEGFRVTFIDYGNSDLVSPDKTRALPGPYAAAQPLAKQCQLALLKAPKEEDMAHEAAAFLAELVMDLEVDAVVELRERGKMHVTIKPDDADVSVNSQMLRAGLARVMAWRRPDEAITKLINKLKTDEAIARQAHVNIWQYGDCIDSDEDEPKGPPPRR